MHRANHFSEIWWKATGDLVEDTSCEPCGSRLRLTTSKELVQLRQTHYLSPPRTCPKQFQFSRKWEWKIKELAHWSHKSKRYPNVSGRMFHKIGGLSVTHHCCPEKYLSKIAPCMTPPHWTSSKPKWSIWNRKILLVKFPWHALTIPSCSSYCPPKKKWTCKSRRSKPTVNPRTHSPSHLNIMGLLMIIIYHHILHTYINT